MIRLDRFFSGKSHVVIFSFDDGREEDRRLVEILDRYGLRATFHINSGKLDTKKYIHANEITGLYKNHEVALHGKNHARLLNCTPATMVKEIFSDRVALERQVEAVITGFSYPCGDVNESIYSAARMCGVEYARTICETHQFGIPDDFLLFNPTCHVYDAFTDSKKFMEKLSQLGRSPLFLIWGHSFEFERDNRWNEFERFCEEISGKEDIWYTSCKDFVAYIKAIRGLRISADETMVENPSSQPVWISYHKKSLKISGGEKVKVK